MTQRSLTPRRDDTPSAGVVDDAERCYRAVQGRDRRFDGVFYTGVRTTGIYCRPSCPAITPQRKNVVFFVTAAAAQGAGFRACRRCRPDLTPGSPEWDVKADVAGRAMRMIADGVVERDGVEGLAHRAGYTSRHLNRVLSEQLGASPLSLARAQRAHTARILIETTDMGFADVAFAAGFASVRQFNATIAEVYAATPTRLRAQRRQPSTAASSANGLVTVSLAVRSPFDATGILGFLAARAVPGLEAVSADDPSPSYARTLRLPHGHGSVVLTPTAESVTCALSLGDLRDLAAAVERCRRLLDLDADPVAIDEHLSSDLALRPWVQKSPGKRVPGHVDGFEVAVRAVIGQQISVAGARTIAGRLTTAYGDRIDGSDSQPALTHVFPDAETLAAADPDALPMPRSRGRALVRLALAVAQGEVVLDRGADRADIRSALLALPGIGPWTADYISMRALGDPDVFLGTDLGARQGLAQLGIDPDDAAAGIESWRPWRSYALMHVWSALSGATGDRPSPDNRDEVLR
ncbi:MAG: AlkA N-terminal domain-containing protein [Nocardioidaceae bacterium]